MTASDPVRGSRPIRLRIRKSPRLNSSRYSLIARPMSSPVASTACPALALLDQPTQVVERRLPAELADNVVLSLGDDERPADRATTLRNDRFEPGPAKQHADGPVLLHFAVQNDGWRPAPIGLLAMPPATARPG